MVPNGPLYASSPYWYSPSDRYWRSVPAHCCIHTQTVRARSLVYCCVCAVSVATRSWSIVVTVGRLGFVVASGSESQLEQPVPTPSQTILNNNGLIRMEEPR